MNFNLVLTVADRLKHNPQQKFTAREIAKWVFETFPAYCKDKKENSKATAVPLDTDEALIQQIAAEIASQRPRLLAKFQDLKTTDGRPRLYYYSGISDEAEASSSVFVAGTPKGNESSNYHEHELYPKLSEFLWSELKVFTKRIDEKKSKNTNGSGGNKWLFPDIVGMEDLSEGWHKEIKSVVQQTAGQQTKLWSFEVKKFVNKSNVREVFFQTVSNSSWANFGYLAAAEIQGADKELRILSGLHGIGVIKIDANSPSDSQIIIPAKERISPDWNAANRLADENSDFLEYLKLIRQFYQTGEHRRKDWDIPSEIM